MRRLHSTTVRVSFGGAGKKAAWALSSTAYATHRLCSAAPGVSRASAALHSGKTLSDDDE